MGRGYVRLPVSSRDLSNEVRVRGNTIVALVDKGAFFGDVDPAISTDDGGSWRINGPEFSRAAACGPCTTDRLAVSSDGTELAWGRGGNFVKTLAAGDTRWRQANFEAGVRDARSKGRVLVVDSLGEPAAKVPLPAATYSSTDDGRTWDRTSTGT